MNIARVVLDVPLAREFDYFVEGASAADIGLRVTVPFGNKRVVGVLVGLGEESELDPTRLKPVETLHRETPPLDTECLDFLRFCARYYHHPLGQVILQALPPGLRRPRVWAPRTLRVRAPARATRAVDATRTHAAARAKTAGADADDASGAGQPAGRPHVLSTAQRSVVEAIGAALAPPCFGVHLLHGVTGSGKTEVYLALAERAIAAGRKVLMLVPEINLTPQLEARVRAHFPATTVIALHSELAGVARVRNWLQAGESAPAVIVGTRLAVLAPLPGLGLVVVDEEHDASYKQQEGLRYSARDLAIVRARNAGCPVVLGSATPSLETLAQAARARYRRHDLVARADPRAQLPAIELVDLRLHAAREGLSDPVRAALRACLGRAEQSLVFVNRRGYAPVLWCSGCGWSPGCPRCSSRLVVHLRARQARCHLCGYRAPIPARCPECGNGDLRPAGEGTQRLEAALQVELPAARILRVDADTMGGRGQFAALRETLLAGGADVLVGTQMLSKGHDFPALTCVVVVNADAALFSADFRATERLMAQLLQVAGRAGRAGRPGRVLIQTAQPGHALFQALLRHDYLGYAESLLRERQLYGFPPQRHQAIVHASGPDAAAVEQFLLRARDVQRAPGGVEVYDPVPALLARVAHKFRYQLLIQSTERARLQQFLAQWVPAVRALASGAVQWVVDVDPIEV